MIIWLFSLLRTVERRKLHITIESLVCERKQIASCFKTHTYLHRIYICIPVVSIALLSFQMTLILQKKTTSTLNQNFIYRKILIRSGCVHVLQILLFLMINFNRKYILPGYNKPRKLFYKLVNTTTQVLLAGWSSSLPTISRAREISSKVNTT